MPDGIIKGTSDGIATEIIRIDAATHVLNALSHAHHKIHDGDHYFMDEVFDVAIGVVTDIRITTPDTQTWAHLMINFITESETEWWFYEGVTIETVGAAYTPLNSNRNSNNASALAIDSIFNADIANADADTPIADATTIHHGITGDHKDTGSHEEHEELILRRNTIYDIRLVATIAGYLNGHMHWYEHADI